MWPLCRPRELAYAYLKLIIMIKAIEHALLEYNRRPENIDVRDGSWIYYCLIISIRKLYLYLRRH